MKIARILFFLFAGLLLASNLLAQSQSAEPRIANAGELYVWPMGLPRPLPHTTMHTAGLDFSITRDTNWQNVSDGVEHAFVVNVHNSSPDTLAIYFSRNQQLPAGWKSSVCWGPTCYSDADDSELATVPPDSIAVLSLDLTPALSDAPDSSVVWLRLGVIGSATSDTMLLPFYASYVPPNPPLVFQWPVTTVNSRSYEGPGVWSLSNFLENHAGKPLSYSLSIQDSVPAGWSLTFCDRQNPSTGFGDYEDVCASGDSLIANFSKAFDSTYRQRIKFTLNAPTVTKEDSAVIHLSVHPLTSNPADSGNYRFVMIVRPQSNVAGELDDRAGLAVTNAWPNPLHSSGSLHLEILTDRAGQANGVIYDLTGAQKGTLDLGMLQEGTNELQLSIPPLSSGEYIIRVNQGSSASEVVRINYVK